MDLCAHSPLRIRRRLRYSLDDAFCRADLIRRLRHFIPALGMHDYPDTGMCVTHPLDVLWLEALMNRAVALPEDGLRLPNCFRRISAIILIRIPNDHFVQRDSHAKRRVAS